jgi:hypothetical protein
VLSQYSRNPYNLLNMDPPEHTRIRRVLMPSFSTGALQRLRPRVLCTRRLVQPGACRPGRRGTQRGAGTGRCLGHSGDLRRQLGSSVHRQRAATGPHPGAVRAPGVRVRRPPLHRRPAGRLELQVAFATLLRRLPNLSPAIPEPEPGHTGGRAGVEDRVDHRRPDHLARGLVTVQDNRAPERRRRGQASHRSTANADLGGSEAWGARSLRAGSGWWRRVRRGRGASRSYAVAQRRTGARYGRNRYRPFATVGVASLWQDP